MRPLIQLVRPLNLGLLVFSLSGFLLFGFYAHGFQRDEHPVLLSLLFLYIVSSVTASGYIINDLQDIKADLVNKPSTMVLGKTMLPSQGLRFYFALLFDALLFSMLLYWYSEKTWATALVFVTQALLFVYSKYLKGTVLWGNLLVSVLVVAPYWFALYVFDFGGTILAVLLVLSICAFSINFSREIAKDIQDARGDAFAGYSTLPVKFGIKTALFILRGSVFMGVFTHATLLILVLIYPANGILSAPMAWFPVFLVMLMLMFLLFKMSKDHYPIDQVSRLLKAAMFVGAIWPYYLLMFL